MGYAGFGKVAPNVSPMATESMMNTDSLDVLAPNFKRRLSGVTSTVVRLVPLQAKSVAIAATGAGLPAHVPQVSLWRALTMSRHGPSGVRVWHARRNSEMLGGLVLKHLLRKRLKLLFTSASQRKHSGYTKALIRRMDRIIATSRKTASYLERDSTVVMHGIDVDTFQPTADKTAIRTRLGLPETGPLIGCFGRVRAQKGTDVFVSAMIDLVRQNTDCHGIIMGRATSKDSAYEQDLKRMVREAGLSDRILFLPEVPVWEMPTWYQALDIYVAPQRWEGFGLTPLEAMACAVPVIATRVGAFEELILDGRTGALIEPSDVAAMTREISALLADQERLQSASHAARAHVCAEFPLEKEANELTDIYRQMLA